MSALAKTITLRSDHVIEPITWCGGDWLTLDAARVSSKHAQGAGDRSCLGIERDEKLMDDLTGMLHGGPFTHGSVTCYVETTLAVLREWRTHKIVVYQDEDETIAVLSTLLGDLDGYSEASARYRPLKGEFWVPPPDRPMMAPEGHKRMRPVYRVPTAEEYVDIIGQMQSEYQSAWDTFTRLLEMGVASEVARNVLGVGIYTAMYVTMNPRSIMHFLSLRTHDDRAATISYPLPEIEVAARKLEALFAREWPLTYQKFNETGRRSP